MTIRSYCGFAMPKDTFFNLPEEKRALICQAAVDEFASHSFAQASINRIVAESGIAKGSFYQYFDNKTDLFFYLLQLVVEEKLKYLAPVTRNLAHDDFFSMLRKLYRAGIQFAVEHPQYAEIGKRLMASKGMPIYDKVLERNMPTGLDYFETLLKDAIARGEIREDVDTKMLAYLINSLNTSVGEYYFEHVGPHYEKMMETIEKLLDYLRYGIGKKDDPEPAGQEN